MNREDKWKRITLWFLGILTALVVVYDIIVAFFNDEQGDTISRVVQYLAYEHWALAFAFGAVFIGHFFLYGHPLVKQPYAFMILMGIFSLILVADTYQMTPFINPVWTVGLGAIAGRFLWPMTPL